MFGSCVIGACWNIWAYWSCGQWNLWTSLQGKLLFTLW